MSFRSLMQLALDVVTERRYVLALLAILAAASALRLWNVADIGLRGDETVYAGQAAVLAGDDQAERYFILASRGNSNFLLFQGILSVLYRPFGVSDVLARVLSASFSILTVLVVFELGRTLYDKRVGLVAALLLTISSYAIALGRLALLDSTLVLFFALSLLFVAKWSQSRKQLWLYCFAAAAALAIQAKIVAVLILPITILYLLGTGRYRALHVRPALVSAMVFLFFMTPVLVQVGQDTDLFLQFLSEGSGRVSRVPWHYYGSLLTGYEGYLIPLLWVAGVGVAVVKRTAGDVLALAWILVVLVFFHAHPLKGFNYLLPVLPAFSLLAGRAICLALQSVRLRAASTGLALAVLVGVSILPMSDVLRDDAFAGLREASQWLGDNTPATAGVMTISRGSAHYTISFYAKRDSYPFGRFRLSTVLPGGLVVSPEPNPSGGTPRDWVEFWPHRLIQNGTVSYLVFYTAAGDDPPEDPIVQTSTQIQFRKLIEDYGGRLVHTEYYNREPRVWVYKVGKLLPRPRIKFTADADQVMIEGEGFLIDALVTLRYHAEVIKLHATDHRGSFSAAVPVPEEVRPRYFLSASDEAGNYASSTGEHIWGPASD